MESHELRPGAGQHGPLEKLLCEVRRRAYERYRDRVAAGKPGDERDDWAAAEHEVLEAEGLFETERYDEPEARVEAMPHLFTPGQAAGAEPPPAVRVSDARVSVLELCEMMRKRGIPQVVVTDGMRTVGLVTAVSEGSERP